MSRRTLQAYRFLYGIPVVYPICLLSATASAAAFFADPAMRAAFAAAFFSSVLLTAAVALRHLGKMRLAGQGWTLHRVVPVYLGKLELPQLLRGYVRIEFGDRIAIASPEVNKLLNAKPLPFEFDGRYRLPEDLRRTAPFVLKDAFTSGKEIFNAPKIRLATDITTRSFDGEPLRLQKTDYFSGLASNDMVGVEIRKGDKRIFDGKTIVTDNVSLFSLARSPASNHIGVSVLAFTSDGHLLMTASSLRSMQNTGQTTPSASGALAPEDFSDAGERGLQFAIAAAAKRELREEFDLDPSDEIEVRLTGYARLLGRGGKPEFYAVASINRPLRSFHVAESERGLIDAVRTIAVRTNDLSDFTEELERMIEEGKHSLSPALYMSLFFLRAWIQGNPGLFQRLLAEAAAKSTHETSVVIPFPFARQKGRDRDDR